jgi:hypothetical protein
MNKITQFFHLENISIDNAKVVSIDEAIELFKLSPNRWFFVFPDHPFCWPEKLEHSKTSLGNAYIFVGGNGIGYIHNISCQGDLAEIGHFAVARGLERRGIGYLMAKAIAYELKNRYGISKIIFSENSTSFIEADYPKFFSTLGALPVKDGLRVHKSGRPDFEWKI